MIFLLLIINFIEEWAGGLKCKFYVLICAEFGFCGHENNTKFTLKIS